MRYALLVYDAEGASGAPYVLARPSTATCVADGTVTDGPYDGNADELRGFDVIEVDTLDDAIEAAARIDGTIEIRPLAEQRG